MPTAPLQHDATLGIDIGKNSFHLSGLHARGASVLRQKLSRGQMEARLANMPNCLIGTEACVGYPSSKTADRFSASDRDPLRYRWCEGQC